MKQLFTFPDVEHEFKKVYRKLRSLTGVETETPGIDDVLSQNQSLTTDRSINIGLANEFHILTATYGVVPFVRISDGEIRLGDDDNQVNGTKIHLDDGNETITNTATYYVFQNIQEFPNNAAAITGGVPVGGLYRSGDNLEIVH